MRKKNQGPLFHPSEKKAIFGLSFIFFFRMMGLFLLLPIFSVLASELKGATPALIGFAFGCYGLSQAILQIPFGIWSDYAGRKKVIGFAIILFIAGSLLATFADNIYMMIAARFLQGSGAMSAAIFALIGDLTRPEVRTRANAGIGASIGMSFGIAFLVAPFLGAWIGLQGVFAVVTVLGIISFIILFTIVPTPDHTVPTNQSVDKLLKVVLENKTLNTIHVGAFLCSATLSMIFFVTPLALKTTYGFEKSEVWKFYLPMLFAGGIVMVFAAIRAEVKNQFRQVMVGGTILLLTSFVLLILNYQSPSLPLLVAGLFTAFMGFNVFEPIFPSLVTRLTTPETKGTASGVYNFSQFMGHFAGATIAGIFHAQNNPFIPPMI
ncbi:MAG: putative MFS family arabinose efflux permease, partial [bacterium]